MKKTIILALALALLGGAAYANFGSRDNVPASTLLVPYIVIDTNAAGTPDPTGYQTLTVVTNVSSIKQLIHITVYAADSSPVIDFDEVLSGYDVWSINWRDLVTGDFEHFDTGSATNPAGAATPGGLKGFWTAPTYTATVSAVSPSAWGPTANRGAQTIPPPIDIDAGSNAGCGFPWGYLGVYSPAIIQELQAPLVPWPNQDTTCIKPGSYITNWGGWLSTLTAQPLFFYAIIDSVNACNGDFPDTALGDYWKYLTQLNTLAGDDFYLDFETNYSESLPTVNIESSSDIDYNYVGFYSAYKADSGNLDNYEDNHEPLPTAWAFNYFQNGGVTTEVGVWKNYDDFEFLPNYVLGCQPYIYFAFDESENSRASQSQTCPSGTYCLQPEPNVFPFQTQKVAVNQTNFDGLMSGNGWMLLVFDPSIYGQDGAYNDTYLQTYVFVKYNFGGFTTMNEATEMSNVWWQGNSQMMPYFNTYNGLNTYYE
ncbi:MAG: hypothetical protein ABR961_15080 [Thermoanaerobaculaceae bacterium]|jgi:hypothetical protein